MAVHGQGLARRLVRGNWTHALSMATAARASLVAMTNLQSAAGATSLCWSRGLLEPVGGRAARLTAHRRKLHPAARRAASNVVQTPGVATMYAGATTGDRGCCKREWPFLLMRLFLVNQIFVFCWNR
ncbi:uncharacterized protein LOC119306844 [Triticum dicoccoides]|uniref:uncharacterized protein LOC119306844 n=1 Tax=Triticum dicoccoides TaxID=85692 RepID=UPI00188FE473|nr:uncharacterized protein LOC119306844 [Triticum dicoccoides]